MDTREHLLCATVAAVLAGCTAATQPPGHLPARVTTFEWNLGSVPGYVEAACLEYGPQYELQAECGTRFVPERTRDLSLQMDHAPPSVCLAFYEALLSDYRVPRILFRPDVRHRLCLSDVPSPGSVRIEGLTCKSFDCAAATLVSDPPGVKEVRLPRPPRTNTFVYYITPHGEPNALTFASGALWLSTTSEVVKIDPASDEASFDTVLRGSPRANPLQVAAGVGALWVADDSEDAVVRIDPTSRQVTAKVPVERPMKILFGDDAVWAVLRPHWLSQSYSLARINPKTNRVDRTIPLVCAGGVLGCGRTAEGSSIAIGHASVWQADLSSAVFRLAAETGAVTAKISIPGAASVAVTSDAVWVANTRGQLFRIDPRTDSATATFENIPTNEWPSQSTPGPVIVVDGDSVWIVGRQQMSKLDAKTNRIVATMPSYGAIKNPTIFSSDGKDYPIISAVIDSDMIWLLRMARQARDERHAIGGWVAAWIYGRSTGAIGNELQ